MIVFYSNFINDHQIPFCNAMYELTGGQFRFVGTQPISEERLKMGFVDQSNDLPYVIKSFESQEKYGQALRLARESDVVILGDASETFIEDRLKEGKLTFKYSERFFKLGKWRLLDPRVFIHHYKNNFRFRKTNCHMLCASAYTAPDCRFIKSYPNKTYKWGYFPEVKIYPSIEKIIELKHHASILCVFRLIELKHPEVVIKMANTLNKLGYKFTVDIIGEGVMESKLRKMIDKFNLHDVVKIHGFTSPEKVRENMEKADIFLFTSDRNEGWGAVLNESMNSACAVVASREIGSVPYLIEDGQNGLVFNLKKKDDLANKVKMLLDDKELKRKLQVNAYNTLATTWNAEEASKRLLNLIDCLQNGREIEYTSGPCSRD